MGAGMTPFILSTLSDCQKCGCRQVPNSFRFLFSRNLIINPARGDKSATLLAGVIVSSSNKFAEPLYLVIIENQTGYNFCSVVKTACK